MAEPSDVKAIENISAAVGESEVQIILSNQCMKAQAFLVNRLSKQFKRQREIAKFISNDNLKLEAEIKNAEQEKKSLTLALESIKTANVELKKEWQLAKEMTQENAERIQIGQKKYDELWEQCKSRYESISFVQNWLQATKKKEALEDDINILDKETQWLLQEIKTKENIILELEKKRIIELAEYVVHEKPKFEENISILSKEFKELNSQVEQLTKKQAAQNSDKKYVEDISVDAELRAQSQRFSNVKIDDGWPNLNQNNTSNANSLMPNLQLMNIDLDVMSVKLDQIKKSDLVNASPVKTVTTGHITVDRHRTKVTLTPDKGHEHVSLYFRKSADITSSANETERANPHNYAKRKLINILEDIKLDKNDTYNLVSKVNLDNLQGVSLITANLNKDPHQINPTESTNEKVLYKFTLNIIPKMSNKLENAFSNKPALTNSQDKNEAQNAEIEVLNLTSNEDPIILPPSGFLDQLRSSQEKKKRVSFELPTSVQVLSLDRKKDAKDDDNEENEANVTINSEVNESASSEESFTKMKDMILKKHNLDLSPPFVYGKNTIKLLKRDEVVKSNYFKLSCEEPQPSTSGAYSGIDELTNEPDDNEIDCDGPLQTNTTENLVEDNVIEMNDDQEIVSSAKDNQEHASKPVAGLLFNHGPLGLPESLDMSISTTGFEDGDADYPQFSSLLLSPKTDLPMPSGSKNVEAEPISQDIPNFLSGLRKTGLSFFGKPAATGPNTDGDAPTGSNSFNFAFGGGDKKNRGGLFNMFN